MSGRKILILAIALPTLGAAVYSVKYSGKVCGGVNANVKEYRCPRLYECALESNKPNATGVCRFLPNGLRLWTGPVQGNEVVVTPPIKDPTVEYDIQTKKAQRLSYAQNKFGFEVLKTAVYSDQTNNQNIVISPTSMGLAFSILYNGANASTKDQLANILQIPGFSLYELGESAGFLLTRLNANTPGISSNLTNSIWIRKDIALNESFLKDAQAGYGAYITNLDFSGAQASKTINDWVFGNTAGKISNAVPEQLNPQIASYIINTAYFNGVWKYKFESDKIETRDFYKQDGTKKPTPSMKMERNNFLYFENELFQAVKLPYGTDQKYSMVVLLPKDLGINTLLGKFDSPNWQNWAGSFKERDGTLYLPKFKLEYDGKMTPILKSIGLVLPFDKDKADFSKLSANGLAKDFYVGDVLHRTYIDVTEEGTEAAAVTVIEVDKTSTALVKPENLPFVMDVNKPFFFAITNEETQANLFVGIVRGF
jgi:serine protease inhibitor